MTHLEKQHAVECRNLKILAEWLARPGWHVEDAAWLLAGVCPENSPGWIGCRESSPFHGLPGIETPSANTDPAFDADCAWIEDRILLMRGLLISCVPGGRDGVEPPAKVLNRAHKGNFLPPWLDAARADPTCSALLPKVLRRPSEGGRRTMSEAQTKRRRDQIADDPKHQLLHIDGREAFNHLAARGFGPKLRTRAGRLIAGRIADEILSKLRKIDADNTPTDPRRITDLVKLWLSEKGNGRAISETATAVE